MKRYQFTQTRDGTRRREFNGAGDLVHETILVANALTGGLLDRASGGKITKGCGDCDQRRDDWNKAIPFVGAEHAEP